MGQAHILLLLSALCCTFLDSRKVKLGGKDCKYRGSKVCNGAVIKEVGSKLVNACLDGKIEYFKPKSRVALDYPLVGRDTGPGKGGRRRFSFP